MLRFRVRPCTSSCCVQSPETNDSVSVRSSASSRSAWSTSPPRSRRRGHRVTIADLRFSGSVEQQLRRTRPGLVGIAGMHALETEEVLGLAREIRRLAPGVPIVIGGHTAAAYPEPFLSGRVDAVVLDDGERAVPEIVDALEQRRPLSEVPGIAVGDQSGGVRRTDGESGRLRPRRRSAPGPAARRWLASAVRLPRPSSDVADRDGARLPVPLFVLFDLAAARAIGSRAVDRVGLPGLRQLRRRHLRRRRSVLVSPVAQPRAGHGAAAPRDPQEVDPGAEPGRSRRASCGPARGLAADRA